jgi:PHD/YefM family antitoxin component YafN of YafNO toxin-antitoxin module
MLNKIVIGDIINSIIPISRFNKGEANKIFDEVKQSGYKIVMKNNTPACILIAPEKYEEMTEQLENYALFIEAEKRMTNARSNDFVSEKTVMERLGISEEDLEASEVEID